MSAFTHLPLGQSIPASPHAVSCSLPTLHDVRGYEEKNPETMRALTSGYPRFVVHPFARQLAAHFTAGDPALAGRTLWLASSGRMARGLSRHLETAADAPRLGLRAAPFAEATFAGDATAEIRRVLRRALPACGDDDLLLATCGMNAVFAGFRAAADLQAARGRTVWLQLGWLYLDTIAILKKFTNAPVDYVYVRDALDQAGLERIFARYGDRIAGVVAELPTNPLIQTPDAPGLAALCRRHGAHLILDPSTVSVFDVDALTHADLVVSSLAKYTASEGDLVAGLVAINPAGPDATELRRRAAAELEPVYGRDLRRLACEIGETESVLARIHANTARVAAFLATHPKVRDVFWALHPASRANYLRIARAPDATGGMISFTLRSPMEPFYDRLQLPKGPSFGMKTTLICPYMYLAHYDLVTTPAGLAELSASNLDPDLMRLCCGTEPAEDIIAVLAEALG